MLMWVPGRPVLTVKSYSRLDDPEPLEQWAFDVRTGQETTAPYQHGHLRSLDGVHRITPNGGGEGGYDLHATDTLPQRTISHAGGGTRSSARPSRPTAHGSSSARNRTSTSSTR
ncbi:hypothetical protein ACU686_07730 [Yinghuangia aomiensis]